MQYLAAFITETVTRVQTDRYHQVLFEKDLLILIANGYSAILIMNSNGRFSSYIEN